MQSKARRNAALTAALVAGLVGCGPSGSPETLPKRSALTVNPGASQQARDFLQLLYDLPSRSNRKVISGQVLRTIDQDPADYSKYRDYPDVYDRIRMPYELSGQWVGIASAEYTDWFRGANTGTGPQKILSDRLNPHFIAHAKKGGVAAIHFHPASPGNGSVDDVISADDVLVNPGRIRDNWFRLLDDAARGLRELRENGVVVLWRPMHGVDLGWWWGQMTGGYTDYRRVWAHMVDYFSNSWGLNNLLWVQDWYCVPGGAGYWYVGNDLVDVVSCDTLPMPSGIGGPAEWNWLESTGKPIAVSESWVNESGDAGGQFDHREIIGSIRRLRPNITYFIQFDHPRYPINHLAANRNTNELLNDLWILNAPIYRDDPGRIGNSVRSGPAGRRGLEVR